MANCRASTPNTTHSYALNSTFFQNCVVSLLSSLVSIGVTLYLGDPENMDIVPGRKSSMCSSDTSFLLDASAKNDDQRQLSTYFSTGSCEVVSYIRKRSGVLDRLREA